MYMHLTADFSIAQFIRLRNKYFNVSVDKKGKGNVEDTEYDHISISSDSSSDSDG